MDNTRSRAYARGSNLITVIKDGQGAAFDDLRKALKKATRSKLFKEQTTSSAAADADRKGKQPKGFRREDADAAPEGVGLFFQSSLSVDSTLAWELTSTSFGHVDIKPISSSKNDCWLFYKQEGYKLRGACVTWIVGYLDPKQDDGIALVVQPFTELSPEHAAQDDYRKWEHIAGRLFYKVKEAPQVILLERVRHQAMYRSFSHHPKHPLQAPGVPETVHLTPVTKVYQPISWQYCIVPFLTFSL